MVVSSSGWRRAALMVLACVGAGLVAACDGGSSSAPDAAALGDRIYMVPAAQASYFPTGSSITLDANGSLSERRIHVIDPGTHEVLQTVATAAGMGQVLSTNAYDVSADGERWTLQGQSAIFYIRDHRIYSMSLKKGSSLHERH